jgi:hypothetical protein
MFEAIRTNAVIANFDQLAAGARMAHLVSAAFPHGVRMLP